MLASYRPTLKTLIATAALAVTVAAAGCSFVTNTTAVQCASEAECLARGPEFEGTTCDPTTRTCVKVADDTDLCSTNQECIDRAGGAEAICRKRDRKCVTLKTPECPTVMASSGQLLNDNAIVVGALTPAAHTELGDNMEGALHFAQRELSKQVRGLPAVDGSDDVRPFVVLACREFNAGGFDALIRAARHLQQNVEVPLVIGPVDPANAYLVANEVFIPNRILHILPTGISSSLAKLPNPIAPTPIIWSNSVTDEGASIAAQALISKELEPRLRADGVEEPIRVAVIEEDNFFGVGGANIIQEKLNYNGKTAVENGTDYLRVNIGNLIDPVGNPAPEAKVAAAVQQVIDFKPHIVVHSYAPAAIPPTFFSLVMAWPPTVPHAYHIDILTTFGGFDPLNELLSNVPPLQDKVFSVATRLPPELDSRLGAWLINFRREFPQFQLSSAAETSIVHVWYDAGFLAAYAIVANQNRPLTGANLATTLPQFLPPGQPVRTGTEDMATAFSNLASGQGIDIDGISGAMDFDPRTGFTSYDVEITCPEIVDGMVTRFKKSGFYAQGTTPMGTLNCGP